MSNLKVYPVEYVELYKTHYGRQGTIAADIERDHSSLIRDLSIYGTDNTGPESYGLVENKFTNLKLKTDGYYLEAVYESYTGKTCEFSLPPPHLHEYLGKGGSVIDGILGGTWHFINTSDSPNSGETELVSSTSDKYKHYMSINGAKTDRYKLAKRDDLKVGDVVWTKDEIKKRDSSLQYSYSKYLVYLGLGFKTSTRNSNLGKSTKALLFMEILAGKENPHGWNPSLHAVSSSPTLKYYTGLDLTEFEQKEYDFRKSNGILPTGLTASNPTKEIKMSLNKYKYSKWASYSVSSDISGTYDTMVHHDKDEMDSIKKELEESGTDYPSVDFSFLHKDLSSFWGF